MLKDEDIDTNIVRKQTAVIRSMTMKEKKQPKILNASRRRRIAAGCGLPVCEVNKLVKQYENMRIGIKAIKKKELRFETQRK
jgi:signal recognition particle subunit SRP54